MTSARFDRIERSVETLPAGRYLVKIYLDQTGRLQKDFRAEMGAEELIGEVEVESQWPQGYGKMTTATFPRP